MLNNKPQGVSPRFLCAPQHYADIEHALENIGHVVIEHAFDGSILDACKEFAIRFCNTMDNAYQRGTFNQEERDAYLCNSYQFSHFLSGRQGQRYQRHIIDMIKDSPLLGVFKHLLKGDVAALHGPMLRRVDPRKNLRHARMHADAQVTEYANRAHHSQDEYTLWTPFCDIDHNTPSLFLLHRTFQTGNDDPNSPETLLYNNTGENHRAIMNVSPVCRYSSQENPDDTQAYYENLDALIKTLGPSFYAPTLKKNSVIVFHRGVLHGSFSHPRQTSLRYSTDIRIISDFEKTATYTNKERAYIFRQNKVEIFDNTPGGEIQKTLKRHINRILHILHIRGLLKAS